MPVTFVLGREAPADAGPTARLGRYRALDGSAGASVALDVDGPHALLVVGKRGYGKSYTLGVLAEALARTRKIAPVVLDPMGTFGTLADGVTGDATPVPASVVTDPAIAPATLDPRSWCSLLGLSPESGSGSLVWQAAAGAAEAAVPATLAEMRSRVRAADAPQSDERAAVNHLTLAESWGVFDAEGLAAQDLATGGATVIDLSGLDSAPMNAVVRGVVTALYRARVDQAIDRFPWILLDEAHVFFDGIAQSALETVLTRGRAPGVSLAMATQRPGVVPDVGISQSDILLAHRLTAQDDIDALRRAQPTYMDTNITERMPTDPGEVVAIDDATETVHAATIRERATPHGGDSPSVSARHSPAPAQPGP